MCFVQVTKVKLMNKENKIKKEKQKVSQTPFLGQGIAIMKEQKNEGSIRRVIKG